jgi:hypothetical protein
MLGISEKGELIAGLVRGVVKTGLVAGRIFKSWKKVGKKWLRG